ncbi:cytochrome C [Thioclava sp. SK-1]|uniref:cytochrome c1 n=1 Tax=Thioclava sp. SK-1 TaxID=1889770 RepID=UPI00082476AE|nr:cytochrome c1 [Thioclava sp. SK-1]OCX65949.1 cytochrome C [Thioclava sp. SK-1]
MKKFLITAISALGIATGAFAAGDEGHVEDIAFSFEGPFGTYDQQQLRRGFQVYREVCSSCHGLKFVPLRTLADEDGLGMNPDWVRAYAAEMSIYDAELDDERPRKETDHFPTVTAANAPDLSLMAKARAGFHGPYGTGISQFVNGIGGPEYIYSLLTGYTGEEKEMAGAFFYENHTFPGGWISMNPPLSDDLIEYEDGTPATVHQMAEDVSAFLMWTAEPKLMPRKQWGFVAVLLLALFTTLLYLTNKRIWAPHKGSHS